MSYTSDTGTSPPIPRKESTERRRYGELVVDPYAWLRERGDSNVRAYIDEENAYTQRSLLHTDRMRRQLYEEMLDRIDLGRGTVPVRHGSFEYYSRNEDDKSYPIHCRRRLEPNATEELVLDEN